MAHLRDRFLKPSLSSTLKWSPTISLIGMRQCGKTTLLKEVAKTYFTLDDDAVLGGFQRSEWTPLEVAQPPVAIDECQKLPKLFDRIKLLVDQRKRPGRFLLTGSIRFLSKSQIRESLTGRTVIMELLPFLVSEAHSKPLRSRFLEIKTTGTSDSAMSRWFTENSKHAWLTDALLDQHLERGGLPGIGFRREESVRKRMFQAQLDTLLSRDLQLLTQARVPYEKLIHLHRELCLVQGLPINESVLARKVGLTPPSVRKFIDIFSSLFLLRRHGKTLYCEDGGLAEHAAGAGLLSAQQRIRAFLFRELLGRAFYQFPGEVTLAEYRTRGGAEVPFVWTSKKHGTLGFTVDPEPFPGEKSIRSLESFLKNQSNRQKGVRAIAFSRGKERAVIRNGIIVLPLADLV